MVTGAAAHGRFLGRVCVLSFRTHQPQIDALVEDLAASIRRHRPGARRIDERRATTHRSADAASIAFRAMRSRGLDPEFPPDAIARRSPRSTRRRATTEEPTRDLRPLLWCSIDNDDSRDLDQLSVAEPRRERRREDARRDRRRRRGGATRDRRSIGTPR